jgi:microcystin-dependent protein
VPAFHVLGWGQALTRTSYPVYLAKVTKAVNGTRTSGNATITGVADTSAFGVGIPAESTGVNAGCTIASWVADTSVTLNSAGCVTASGTSTITVFLTGYGAGGNSTTVGVPNCTGRVMAGREPTASKLTSSYFGGNSTSMLAVGGSESQTLTLAQLPTGITSANASQAISVSSAGGVNVMVSNGTALTVSTPGSGAYGVDGGHPWSGVSLTSTGSNSISVTSNNTSGAAHPNVQPTLIAECVVRVVP